MKAKTQFYFEHNYLSNIIFSFAETPGFKPSTGKALYSMLRTRMLEEKGRYDFDVVSEALLMSTEIMHWNTQGVDFDILYMNTKQAIEIVNLSVQKYDNKRFKKLKRQFGL